MCVKCCPRLACVVRIGYSGTTDSAFIDIFVKRTSLLSEYPDQTESVVPDWPVRTAEANLGRQFTRMHLTPFFHSETQLIFLWRSCLMPVSFCCLCISLVAKFNNYVDNVHI